jgi:hypothetical protein
VIFFRLCRRLKTILVNSGRRTACLADIKKMLTELEILPETEKVKNWSLYSQVLKELIKTLFSPFHTLPVKVLNV